MSRNIDYDKPLSAEDRAWLHEWSMDWRIEENDRRFNPTYQNSSGHVITNDPNNAGGIARDPHEFAKDQIATGPVTPNGSDVSVQQYVGAVGTLPGTKVELDPSVLAARGSTSTPEPTPEAEPGGEEVLIEDLTDPELDKELKGLELSTIGTRQQREERLAQALKVP